MNLLTFTKSVLVFFLILAVVLFTWQVINIILALFAAVLFAVFLRHLALVLCARTGLAVHWSIGVVMLTLVVLIALFGWLLGAQLVAQARELLETLPGGVDELRNRIREYEWGDFVLQHAPDAGEKAAEEADVMGAIAVTLTTLFSAIGGLILVITAGVYFAVTPGLYRSGVLQLAPPSRRPRIKEVMDVSGQALWSWLLGQMIVMLFVGLGTMLGLWIIGIPLALVLGLLAGILNFIPIIGPFISFVPIILIAFTEGAMIALYAAILFVVVQQIESNVLMPLVQQRAVAVPPVISIVVVVMFGILFGPLGLLLAVPLAVVAMVMVKMLYVEDVLGDKTPVPGRD